MPMPSPGKKDDEKSFMARCMGDEHMNEKFPDQEQRAAVCMKQFEGDPAPVPSDKLEKLFKKDTQPRAQDGRFTDAVSKDDPTKRGWQRGASGFIYIPQ